jgi:hypothetical protein
MTYGRPVQPINVKDNADGTLRVECMLCNRTWPSVPDKNWPALHAAYHADEL